jgi:uncharacterized membrane protein
MEQIHQLIVYSLVLVLVLSLFLDLIVFISKKEAYRKSAFYVLILGVSGGIASIIHEILLDRGIVNSSGEYSFFEAHDGLAVLTVILLTFLLIGHYISLSYKENN